MSIANRNGGRAAAIPFRRVWCIDFEFKQSPGERPWSVCLVAREYFTGHRIRKWRGDLTALRNAPFDVGPDAVAVAFVAQAELSCFMSLGWQLPENVVCLFAEHRVLTNGLILPCGNGLLGALACRGLAHIDAGEKEAMRRLVLDNDSWTHQQQQEIIQYCESDVDASVALLGAMSREIDWPRALLRGKSTAAVAAQQHAGVPIDTVLHQPLAMSWDRLKLRLVHDVDEDFGVYDGAAFKVDRFAAWTAANGIAWPRLPSGRLALDDDTFKQQALRHPRTRPLRELRNTLGKLRLTGLAVGADGRNRCSL